MAKKLRLPRLLRLTKRQRNITLVVVLLAVIGVLVWHFTKPSGNGAAPAPSPTPAPSPGSASEVQAASITTVAPTTTAAPVPENCLNIGTIRPDIVKTTGQDVEYFYKLYPNEGKQLTQSEINGTLNENIIIDYEFNNENVRPIREFFEFTEENVNGQDEYSYVFNGGTESFPRGFISDNAYLCDND